MRGAEDEQRRSISGHRKNIVTDKPVSYATYYVMAEYDNLEEEKNRLENDLDEWHRKYPRWCRMNYPLGWATIKG